jgi:PAS domain S-box-containing protein
VKFYEAEALLCDAASDFICEGLKAGEPVLLIVTDERLGQLGERLAARGVDVAAALREGQLTRLDAQEILARVLVGDMPERRRFAEVVGGALEQIAHRTGRARVRAFGELVDLLWRRGNATGAIRLEELWSEQHDHHNFGLFCAYLLGNFYKEQTGAAPTPASREVALHQQVEAALRLALQDQRRARAELQSITDALPVIVTYVDRELKLRFVNRALETFLGQPRDRIVGCTIHQLTTPQAVAETMPHIEQALSGKTVEYQTRVRDAQGNARYWEMTLLPQRDESGQVVGIVGLASDHTDEKRIELVRSAAEAQSERLLKITAAIAEAVSPEQVYQAVVDQTALVLGAGSAALWLLAEDGRTTELVHSIAYSEAQRARFDGVALDSPHRFPALDSFRDGTPIFIGSREELLARYPAVASAVQYSALAAAALPLKAQARTIGVLAFTFVDSKLDDERRSFMQLVARYSAQAIERLRVMEAERESRSRAELLYGLARACIGAGSLDDIFDAALETLQKALGADRSAILLYDAGGTMRFKRWRGLSDGYRAAVEGHSPWTRDEKNPLPVAVGHAQNDPNWAAYRVLFEREGIGALAFIPLVASGRLLGKFMVYYDRPRTLPPHQLELATAIANHVAAATARFSALKELEQTVRFNEMFTAILGHDLRNPLGAIMASAQLAQKRGGEDKVARPLERILSSGARMARMIDQLLDFTRVRVGQGIPLSPLPLHLMPLLKQVIGELEMTGAAGRLTVTADGDPRGTWDGDRLGQVFSNLVTNALEHGTKGGAVAVHVDGTAAAGVRVTVHNSGAVPPEKLPGMFDPMTTNQEPRRERSQGLGLGLFITQEITRAHGGSIAVESSVAAGTTFTVFLPRESR